ncbi:hypothetical protein MUK42_37393 [Musa troglodytarum]|uniref:Uncharacterized protein n=1 Tax=Musa troglodytarum TaxID=320322 RepID=A0A9E7FHB3_9LILI|nr:hypothetical protein MUK42_37393 [Musa troglodytarum]
MRTDQASFGSSSSPFSPSLPLIRLPKHSFSTPMPMTSSSPSAGLDPARAGHGVRNQFWARDPGALGQSTKPLWCLKRELFSEDLLHRVAWAYDNIDHASELFDKMLQKDAVILEWQMMCWRVGRNGAVPQRLAFRMD